MLRELRLNLAVAQHVDALICFINNPCFGEYFDPLVFLPAKISKDDSKEYSLSIYAQVGRKKSIEYNP